MEPSSAARICATRFSMTKRRHPSRPLWLPSQGKPLPEGLFLLAAQPDTTGIASNTRLCVFRATREATELTSEYLRAKGWKAERFHAGLTPPEKFSGTRI